MKKVPQEGVACPPKNAKCLCGSGKKYKKCCRPGGPSQLTVPLFGKIERVGDVSVNGRIYPVFVFEQDSDPDDDYFMYIDKKLQDEGYVQWFRESSVSDGPLYSQLVNKDKVSAGEIFAMNVSFANAEFIQVDVVEKGKRIRRPIGSPWASMDIDK